MIKLVQGHRSICTKTACKSLLCLSGQEEMDSLKECVTEAWILRSLVSQTLRWRRRNEDSMVVGQYGRCQIMGAKA